jgi:glycosyltransferase involved in cell wall biosynthesis
MKIQPELSCRYVLSISDLYPHKNIINLLEAFDVLVEEFKYDGCLVIIGKLTYYDYDKYFRKVQKKIESIKHGCMVRLMGHVEHENLYVFYKNADIFVFPSIEETFGIPLIEAMTLKTPIVASDCSGLSGKYFNPSKEICGDSAKYFDPSDVKDIAQTIHRVIEDQSCRDEISKNAARRIIKYDLQSIAKQLVREFENL